MGEEDFIKKYCYVPVGGEAYIDSSIAFRKDLDELLKQEAIGFGVKILVGYSGIPKSDAIAYVHGFIELNELYKERM